MSDRLMDANRSLGGSSRMANASNTATTTTGRQLRAARRKAHLTGMAVASAMGCRRQRVSQLEALRIVTPEAAAKYIAALVAAAVARDGEQADSMTEQTLTLERRFWSKVQKSDGCWLWTGHRRPSGHGSFWFDGRLVSAHRVAWLLTHGPIPDGLVPDHLCRNPPCVNPDHLEIVTQSVNTVRGKPDHCPHGHPYDAANTYVRPNGWRDCRACWSRKHGYRQRNKLTPETVRWIRDSFEAGTTTRDLAFIYGVHVTTIRRVVSGKAWLYEVLEASR